MQSRSRPSRSTHTPTNPDEQKNTSDTQYIRSYYSRFLGQNSSADDTEPSLSFSEQPDSRSQTYTSMYRSEDNFFSPTRSNAATMLASAPRPLFVAPRPAPPPISPSLSNSDSEPIYTPSSLHINSSSITSSMSSSSRSQEMTRNNPSQLSPPSLTTMPLSSSASLPTPSSQGYHQTASRSALSSINALDPSLSLSSFALLAGNSSLYSHGDDNNNSVDTGRQSPTPNTSQTVHSLLHQYARASHRRESTGILSSILEWTKSQMEGIPDNIPNAHSNNSDFDGVINGTTAAYPPTTSTAGIPVPVPIHDTGSHVGYHTSSSHVSISPSSSSSSSSSSSLSHLRNRSGHAASSSSSSSSSLSSFSPFSSLLALLPTSLSSLLETQGIQHNSPQNNITVIDDRDSTTVTTHISGTTPQNPSALLAYPSASLLSHLLSPNNNDDKNNKHDDSRNKNFLIALSQRFLPSSTPSSSSSSSSASSSLPTSSSSSSSSLLTRFMRLLRRIIRGVHTILVAGYQSPRKAWAGLGIFLWLFLTRPGLSFLTTIFQEIIPAYYSMESILDNSVVEQRKWLMYLILLLSVKKIENITSPILSFIPFWQYIKLGVSVVSLFTLFQTPEKSDRNSENPGFSESDSLFGDNSEEDILTSDTSTRRRRKRHPRRSNIGKGTSVHETDSSILSSLSSHYDDNNSPPHDNNCYTSGIQMEANAEKLSLHLPLLLRPAWMALYTLVFVPIHSLLEQSNE